MIAGQRVSSRFPILSAALALVVVGAFFSLPVRGQAVREAADEQPAPANADVAAPRPAPQTSYAKANSTPFPSSRKGALKYRTAKVTVDPTRHCLFVGQQAAAGQGRTAAGPRAWRDIHSECGRRGIHVGPNGSGRRPFPGVVFYYSTDEEDGYAVRYVVLKPGDSVTFRTPWLISPVTMKSSLSRSFSMLGPTRITTAATR